MDESLKLLKLLISSFYFIPDEQTSQQLVIRLFCCYFFKTCRYWTLIWGSDLTRIVFSLNSTFSDPVQSLLMSWRVEFGVLDEGGSAGMLHENHLRDMFLM